MNHYRILIVGAGLAGLSLARALEVVPRFVDLEVAVPHLSPAVW